MKRIFSLYFFLLPFLGHAQNFQNDIDVLQKKINRYEKGGDTLNQDYIISLNNLASLYEEHGNSSQAEQIFLKTLNIRQKYLGLNHVDVAKSLIHLSDLYYNQGKYNQAEPLCQKALEIRKITLGEKNSDYVKTLGKLASIYLGEGKYSEAEKLYFQGLVIKKEIFGENDPSYLLSLNNIISLYITQGKYSQAEKYYLNILEIKKKTIGEKNPGYITSLNNLAVAYFYQGKYSDSESLYIKVIDLRKEVLGEKNIDYASSLNNLAELYRTQKKFDKAEVLYKNALDIISEIHKENDEIYFISLSNLALLYTEINNSTDAEPLLIRVLEWTKRNFGEESANYATSLQNLGAFYFYQSKYSEAENYLSKSLEIRKKILGKNHPDYALSLNSLANLYSILNDYTKALSLNIESIEIRKEILGKNHPDYISSLCSLAENYQDLCLNKNAAIYFDDFVKIKQERMIEDFYGLTENEIVSYLKINNFELIRPLSFLNDFSINYPEINTDLYRNELIIKNLSLRNQERITKSIQKSGNQSLRDKYQQFLANKIKIKKIQELPLLKRPANFVALVDEMEQIEKELSKESSTFSDYKKAMSVTLNDVKNKLTSKDVAIDFISFKYYNKTVTDRIVYAAFIVKKDFKVPKFISLFEEKQLDFLLGRNKTELDSTRIDEQYLDKAISDLFLKPLEKELLGITTIYLSPTGLGHQIDFAALPLSENQTFGEKYNLHILSSPAELVDYKVSSLDKKNNIALLLYGGIDYNKNQPKAEIDKEIMKNTNDIISLRSQSGISGFDYLNGTNKEINQIQQKATQNGFTTIVFKEKEATKESIKALDGRTTPYVLHLATHGYFFPDPEQETPKDFNFEIEKSKIYKTSDDPMLRSGLIFAGANKYWSKTVENTATDDGILTASEISNLDLSACQLVVLSACETGLGEVKGSEGVFGLQRAFKMSGVKNIIMSLWKVPDAQTAELFDIFYSECFAGKTIHEAFQSTQSQMKSKYSPFYWAGFVLLE